METKKPNYHEKFAWLYNGQEWKILRERRFSEANGLCELCRKAGIIRKGKEVHHIVPIEKDLSKALNYENTILLCDECHRSQHERGGRFSSFIKFWESLEVIENGGKETNDK